MGNSCSQVPPSSACSQACGQVLYLEVPNVDLQAEYLPAGEEEEAKEVHIFKATAQLPHLLGQHGSAEAPSEKALPIEKDLPSPAKSANEQEIGYAGWESFDLAHAISQSSPEPEAVPEPAISQTSPEIVPEPEADRSLEILFNAKGEERIVHIRQRPLGAEFSKRSSGPIKVRNVHPQSHASEIGLQVGWIIKAIAGEDMTKRDFYETQEALKKGLMALPEFHHP